MTESSHPVLNATRARQGRYGRHMFWVLIASTLLAAAGLFIAWTVKSPQLAAVERNNAKQPALARAFDAPAESQVLTVPTPPAKP